MRSLIGLLLLTLSATAARAQTPAGYVPILPSSPTPTYVEPAHVVSVPSPNMKATVATSGFSPEFIHSIFPSTKKPGYMTEVAGKGLVCHGFGVQGGQYACYAANDQKDSIDCFFDRYINETPIAQTCGKFKLPTKMTKLQTSEAEVK